MAKNNYLTKTIAENKYLTTTMAKNSHVLTTPGGKFFTFHLEYTEPASNFHESLSASLAMSKPRK